MQQHIQIFNDSNMTPCGLVNICNIEEVWLNDYSNSVAIRYRSPNGTLMEHEEYFDCNRTARLRYSSIKADILESTHNDLEILFRKSIMDKAKEMEAEK